MRNWPLPGEIYQQLSGNETISGMLSFVTIISTALLLLGASAESIIHISEGFDTKKKARAAVKYTSVINEYYKGFESYYFPEQQQNDRNSDSSRTTG